MAYPPKIYTHRVTGLRFQNLFGPLGPEKYVTGHYSGTRRDMSDQDAIQMVRNFHRDHKDKKWGGLAYWIVITRKGNIILGRPSWMKGAHVGGWNSNNIGVMMIGTVGHRPTRAQRRTYKWLLANAHTNRLPRTHRTDRPLSRARRRAHKDWPGHSTNQCAGNFSPMYRRGY